MRLLIERAREGHLGTGAAVALVGGVLLGAEASLPPVALAAVLALVLAVVVFVDRTLVSEPVGQS